MTQAKLTVLLPTRNRPRLFLDAVNSILLQNSSRLEIIVFDSNEDDVTEKMFRTNFPNKIDNLIYVRANPKNSMPENWQKAYSLAKGEFITLLTDRSVYMNGSLQRILDVIDDHRGIEVLSWGWSVLSSENSIVEYQKIPAFNELEKIPNSQLIEMYIMRRYTCPSYLPRGLNSCIKKSILEEIEVNLELCSGINPDYRMSFILASRSKASTFFLNDAIFISQGLIVSNGQISGTSLNWNYLNSVKNKNEILSNVPINFPILSNIIYADLFEVLRKLAPKGSLKNNKLKRRYMIAVINDLLRLNLKRGIKKSETFHVLSILFGELRREKWSYGIPFLMFFPLLLILCLCISILPNFAKKGTFNLIKKIRKGKSHSITYKTALTAAGFD